MREDGLHVVAHSLRLLGRRHDNEWRETCAARLSAERPTNQARRERGIAQYPRQDDLTFGSAEELRVIVPSVVFSVVR